VLHGHVVNQFLNQNRLANTSPAEETDFSTFQKGLNKVHNFNPGFKHFERGGLLVQLRSGTMNGIIIFADQRTELVNRLPQHIHYATKSRATHGNGDGLAGIERLHPAHHAVGRFHGDSAHTAFAEMLLHFGGDIQRLWILKALAGDAHGVKDRRQMSRFKLNIQHRSDDLHHMSDRCVLLCHRLLL
jgi:hypothetical protein